MEQIPTLFLVIFTTLLAMINPLESIPVFLKLLEGGFRGHLTYLVGIK